MRVRVFCDAFPEPSETFVVNEVRALGALGADVEVESVARPADPAAVGIDARCWEDERTRSRLAGMAMLALRHPLRCVRDVVDRRRWRREELVVPLRMLAPAARRASRARPVHLHAHFAAGAALSAMRIGRIVGVPYSVTAHAYDIYQRPANLVEKLRRSAFATSGCAYTVADLRALAGPEAQIHEIVMGVDGEKFRRQGPHPPVPLVVAIGRLVEKKGFADLVEAAALLRERGAAPDRVVIAGDGPLRAALAARARERGVGDLVELAGLVDPARVRALLEEATVLCMPSVVAADGDRDSMPVVVKEALAMEVPVVATDEVGLPEVVRPEWGRLVPPGRPEALADAIAELLALPVERRAAMGRAGREHVLEACSLADQTARLAELIRSTSARSAGRSSRAAVRPRDAGGPPAGAAAPE